MAEHEAQQAFFDEFLFQKHLGGVHFGEHIKGEVQGVLVIHCRRFRLEIDRILDSRKRIHLHRQAVICHGI